MYVLSHDFAKTRDLTYKTARVQTLIKGSLVWTMSIFVCTVQYTKQRFFRVCINEYVCNIKGVSIVCRIGTREGEKKVL